MKKILIPLMVIILSFAAAHAGINDGLVAHYPFNGNANDESGNGNNGTVNGATLTTDRFGNGNSAYAFDGVDDYIQIEESALIDFQNTDSFSMAFWFKTYSSKPNMVLIGKSIRNYANGYGFIMYHTYAGNCPLPGYIDFFVGGGTGESCSWALNDGSWHFLTGIYNSSTNLILLYVDGVLQNDADSRHDDLENSADLFFGGGEDPELAFEGSMDDIRFYSRSLSEAEIQVLYNQ